MDAESIRPACARRSASTSRPWRSIPASRRRGRSVSWANSTLYANSTPHARARGARPPGGGEGGRARARAARRRTWRSASTNGWFAKTSTAPWSSTRRGRSVAPGNADLLTGTARWPSRPSDAGRRRSSTSGEAERLDPRSVITLRSRRRAPPAAALSRGAGSLRPGARHRAHQPRADREQGHDVPRRGRSRRCPGTCSRPRPRRSSPPRSWPTWRTTGISSGSSTSSSESSSCGSRRARSTTTGATGASASLQAVRPEGRRGERAHLRRGGKEGLRGAASRRARETRSATSVSASRSRTSVGKRKRSGRESVASPSIPVAKDALTGPYIQHQLVRIYIARRRAGQGARPAGAAPEDSLLPLARLAQDRPQLRPAAQQPEVPEARRRREVVPPYGAARRRATSDNQPPKRFQPGTVWGATRDRSSPIPLEYLKTGAATGVQILSVDRTFTPLRKQVLEPLPRLEGKLHARSGRAFDLRQIGSAHTAHRRARGSQISGGLQFPDRILRRVHRS